MTVAFTQAAFGQQRAPQFRSADEEMRTLQGRVPGGFGGMYFDAEGRAHVFLKDAAQRGAAIAALAPILRSRIVSLARPLDAENIVVETGEFEFAVLEGYRDQLLANFGSIPGLVTLDVNESRNRVVVGVEGAAGVQGVGELLRELNIPPAAVSVEQRQRDDPKKLLTDWSQYVDGGYRIRYYDDPLGGPYMCSLGFNAYWNGRQVFFTNSHCSDNLGVNDNDQYYQNTYGTAAHLIGQELRDPPFVQGTGGACPTTASCRWSDAIAVAWSATSRWSFAKIARPTSEGSVTVSSTTPSYTIVGTVGYGLPGEQVWRVGASTGLSSGSVWESCVAKFEGNRITRCQDTVRWAVVPEGGDSGGPFFSLTCSTCTTVHLRGLVWGTTGTSPFSNLEEDFGGYGSIRAF
jgi:hypothetical protein